MPRIRSIHPGIFTDEAFMTASPHGRTLIMGLWCEAFDDGCVELKPVTLKARIFPVDNVDVGALLDELEGLRVFKRFTIGGKDWGAIRNFRKFQRPKKPNQSPVLTAEMADYVGMPKSDKHHPSHAAVPTEADDLFPESEEQLSEFPQLDPSSPPSSELDAPMEDGGDKMEEIRNKAGRPAYAQAREPSASPPSMTDQEFETECRHVVTRWDPPKGSFRVMLALEGDREAILSVMREVVAARSKPVGTWRLWAEDVIPERLALRKAGPRIAPSGAPVPDLVFIAEGTSEWEAWNRWAKANGRRGFPNHQQVGADRGWRFKSRWPPDHTDNVVPMERVA